METQALFGELNQNPWSPQKKLNVSKIEFSQCWFIPIRMLKINPRIFLEVFMKTSTNIHIWTEFAEVELSVWCVVLFMNKQDLSSKKGHRIVWLQNRNWIPKSLSWILDLWEQRVFHSVSVILGVTLPKFGSLKKIERFWSMGTEELSSWQNNSCYTQNFSRWKTYLFIIKYFRAVSYYYFIQSRYLGCNFVLI